MKIIILIFITLLLLFSNTFGDYVEIGIGEYLTWYVPVYSTYDYSWTRTIYPRKDIGLSFDITKISYRTLWIEGTTRYNQKIFMKHTSDDTYSNGDYEDTTTYTKVYDGTIYWNGSGWFDITLDTPFSYNGIDNLVIYYQNHHGVALPEEDKFNFYYTYDQYRAIYKGQDGSFPTSWGTMCAYPPDIRLHYTISGPMLQLTPTEKNYEDVDVMHPPHKHSPSKILEVENYLSALLVLVEQTVINSL